MYGKKLSIVAMAGVVLFLAGAAQAQSDASARQRMQKRRAPAQIEIVPSRRPYRQCVDWYAVERRPSGDVITPQQHCWWTTR